MQTRDEKAGEERERHTHRAGGYAYRHSSENQLACKCVTSHANAQPVAKRGTCVTVSPACMMETTSLTRSNRGRCSYSFSSSFFLAGAAGCTSGNHKQTQQTSHLSRIISNGYEYTPARHDQLSSTAT